MAMTTRGRATIRMLFSTFLLMALIPTGVQGTSLLNGRFETTADVTGILGIAETVDKIRETMDSTQRKSLYESHSSGFLLDPDGKSHNISLAELSTQFSTALQSAAGANDSTTTKNRNTNPLLVLYQHYFSQQGVIAGEIEEGLFQQKSSKQYADSIVRSTFADGSALLTWEAIVSLTIWMNAVHSLHQAYTSCSVNANATQASVHVDQAAAYWIGTSSGSSTINADASMLYRLAQESGQRFGSDILGETWVNERVMAFLNSLQAMFSNADNCSPQSNSEQVRTSVYDAIKIMTVPLVQQWIHHRLHSSNNIDNEASKALANMYQSAVLPLVASCDTNLESLLLVVDDDHSAWDADQTKVWMTNMYQAFSCLGITCRDVGYYSAGDASLLPECVNVLDLPRALAGYEPSSVDANRMSFLDRDIQQLGVFLHEEAYDAAMEWYSHGYNAQGVSLQALAMHQVILPRSNDQQRDLFDLFQEYYESSWYNFADKEIQRAMNYELEFADATKEQVQYAVTSLLQHEVLYVTIASAFSEAKIQCGNDGSGDSSESLRYWDMAVALFVGSMEGSNAGGREGGTMPFSSTKKLCQAFGTCRDVFELLSSFTQGKDFISSQECDRLESMVETVILPALQVPLVQGCLFYGNALSGAESSDKTFGTLHGLVSGILPMVNKARMASAIALEENLRFGESTTNTIDVESVGEAFQLALPTMDVECTTLGSVSVAPYDGICQTVETEEGEPVAIINEDANLTQSDDSVAWGRYSFSSPEVANQYASIALDVRDISQAPSIEDAKNVYRNGHNAFRVTYYRQTMPMTLSSFSIDAQTFMKETPMFNIFKYSLYNEKDFDSTDAKAFGYADEIVNDLFDVGAKELAAESAVVLNVWMMVVHQLYNAVEACRKRGNAQTQVDAAIALWIGKEQHEGGQDLGWSMYMIGQQAAHLYGFENGEAPVNTNLINEFNELQRLGGECSNDDSAFLLMRQKVQHMNSLLSLPLLHHLVHSMAMDIKWKTELYSVTVIPQSSTCNPLGHEHLSTLLYSGYSKEKLTEETYDHLASFLYCLKLTSNDFLLGDTADPTLIDFMDGIAKRLDGLTNRKNLLGFIPSDENVKEGTRLDLDILQIEAFMRTGAYEAAYDHYKYGGSISIDTVDMPLSNASTTTLELESGALVSLHNIALLPQYLESDHLELFSEFFGSKTYADDLAMACLDKTGIFRSASNLQLAEACKRTFQTMISYIAVVWQLQQSIDECTRGNLDNSLHSWGVGAAFFVGSAGEGKQSKGSSGYGLHGLGVEQCTFFGTCDDSGDAIANTLLIEHLQNGDAMLERGDCSSAQDILDGSILPLLQVPLLQSTLYHSLADHSDDDSAVASPTEGFVFARSILPVVDAANTASAATIVSAFDTPFYPLTAMTETNEVFDAIKYALPAMNIDCELLGTALELHPSLCLEYIAPEITGTLGQLALDVKELRSALATDSTDIAQRIYVDGKHTSDSGPASLQSLSTDATSSMLGDPMFNLFLRSHAELTDDEKPEKSLMYADTIFQKLLQERNGASKTVAADAVVVLHVWMYLNHLLEQAFEACESGQILVNNETNAFDIAASYWIGDADVGTKTSKGNLLYGLAADMEGHFETVGENVLTVNQHMLGLFAEAKGLASWEDTCGANSTALPKLYTIIEEMRSLMAIPIVQGVIHSIRTNDRSMVRLFAQAFVPMTLVCDEDHHNVLQEVLVEGEYNSVNIDSIIDRVYDVLPCLGLTCGQIGLHFSEMIDGSTESQCRDHFNSTVSGYHTTTEFLKFDQLVLDVREIQILLEMEAHQAASKVYSFGTHASVSLAALGLSPGLELLPDFTAYEAFFDSEVYGHDFIGALLAEGESPWTDHQKRVILGRWIQAVILPHGALQALFESVDRCSSEYESASSELVSLWDKAAGMLLGLALEPEHPESEARYGVYDLAQEHCDQFGTCTTKGRALSNERLVELLYAGRGAVSGGSCSALLKITQETRSVLLVPVIQSLLSSTLKLSKTKDAVDSTSVDVAEAYVSSLVLSPLLGAINRDTAEDLQAMFAWDSKHTLETVDRTFDIFARVYNQMGVDCDLVGQIGDRIACTRYISLPQKGLSSVAKFILILLVLCFAILAALMLYRVQLSRRDSEREDRPTKLSQSHPVTKGIVRQAPASSTSFTSSDGTDPLRASSEGINNSFKASKKRVSNRANKILRKMLMYGDDEHVPEQKITSRRAEERPFLDEEVNTDMIENPHNMDII